MGGRLFLTKTGIVAAAVLIGMLVLVGGGSAATNVSSCQVISSSGVYVLNQDLTNSSTCITIESSDVVFDGAGYTVDGTGSNYGVSVYDSTATFTNVTVKNLNVIGWGTGISYIDVQNGSIVNNNVSNNNDGLLLVSSSNNTLAGNVMSANTRNFRIDDRSVSGFVHTIDTTNTVDGKPLYYLVGVSDIVIDSSSGAGFVGVVNSVNVTVRDLTLTKNQYGVLFVNTSNSSILNVTATNNFYGIYLYWGSNNTLTNNTANSNNNDGIYLRSSDNNTVNNNIVSNNYRGIYLGTSSGNTVYNNLFNNTNNAYIDDTNSWNTTKQAGINIVGGPYLGGNFWAYPNGTGFSETCTDINADGICDSAYTLASGNIDYLSLSLNIPDIIVCSSGCDYTSIQAAINAASNGDTISVDAGIYYENVDVNKSVNLVGSGADVTIVNVSNSSDHVFEVTADWVNISGFTITGENWYGAANVYLNNTQNSTISYNSILNNRYGILLDSSFDNYLVNNTIEYNEKGILLRDSDSNVIERNEEVSNGGEGVYLFKSDQNNILLNNISLTKNGGGNGIFLTYSSNNNISGNNLSNLANGIFVQSISENNLISDNSIDSSDTRGIYIVASYNIVRDNSILNSTKGIVISDYYNDTEVYHNNLIDNIIQATDDAGNTWDNGYPSGGNYWSDYDESSEGCSDANTDGFCDSPYNISGEGNQDMYPFVSQDGWEDIRDTENGTNVSVVFPGCGMNMTFGNVTGTGKTTGVRSLRSSGITPLSGYKSAGIFYNISTTANFTGSFEVCVTDFDILSTYRLFHWAGTAWEDITTRIDADSDILCGVASSLSPFEIMESSDDGGSGGSSGGGSASKPKIILLANSIDYNLSANFTALLKSHRIDIIYTTPENFSNYNTTKFIVILGGPDAHDGVGEIVREVLNESEQEYLGASANRKMYVKTNVWATGQVVMIIAGSDRGQTRQAGEENKLAVKKKVKGY